MLSQQSPASAFRPLHVSSFFAVIKFLFQPLPEQLPRRACCHKAQPVPLIFPPEVATGAIYYAAHQPERREFYVGFSIVKAIFGNKLMPGFADHYLARTGYDSQQHDGPKGPNHPNNLWHPVPDDHGVFDNRANSYSMESWLEMNRKWWIPDWDC